jgi:hypothetical protein
MSAPAGWSINGHLPIRLATARAQHPRSTRMVLEGGKVRSEG